MEKLSTHALLLGTRNACQMSLLIIKKEVNSKTDHLYTVVSGLQFGVQMDHGNRVRMDTSKAMGN